jgi:glycerophosphoryl diester phosphodiesterase
MGRTTDCRRHPRPTSVVRHRTDDQDAAPFVMPLTDVCRTGGAGASPGGVFGAGPAVIGHRGLGCGVVSGQRENTLASFTAAVAEGIGWVEADVRRTTDDILVIAHDAVLGDGSSVAAMTGEQADRTRMLRLRTLFETLPADAGVVVDLKSAMDDCLRPWPSTTAGLLAPVVAAEARRRPLMVCSFDPAALGLLRREVRQVPLGWLTWHRFPVETAVAGCAHLDVDVLGLHVGSLPRDPRTGTVDASAADRVVALVHACGRELLVWCPEAEPARVLADAGADALVVDDVPHALGALGSLV